MPRQARIDAPGALHHIIARGIERRKIFRNEKDFCDFIARLSAIVDQTKTKCLAWALIPNHFHLLLKTGNVPIATVMRRLLTGYAVSFNRRHRRHGHVFQNRYKSILCQEETYLLELVRYIHLNPLRAGIVSDLDDLGRFPYSGHGAVSGESPNDWQNVGAVLRLFGENLGAARQEYKQFVRQGVEQGRRPELTGGGMIRSLGGWAVVKELGQARIFYKSDERILGDSDFVDQSLEMAGEGWERHQGLRRRGIEFEQLLQIAAEIFQVPVATILTPGKDRQRVKARSLLSYWAVRELGMTMTAVARRSSQSVPSIALAVRRGEELARENNLSLVAILKP